MNHLRFKGNHYEIGYRWGSLLAGHGNYILDQVPFPITEERIAFGRQCRPVYEKFFPEILEEIRGLSEGQKSSSEKLQAVLFSMYAMPPAGHCSCFSVSSKEQLFLGRNSDFLTEIEEFNKNVIYDFTSDSYGFNGNTTAFLEIEDGINERGLAVGMTSVFPKHIQPGMNSGMLLRFFLEKCSTVDEVIKWLHRIPIASAQTFTVADQMGDISVIECCADSTHIRKPEEGQPYVCAVNRFHSPELEKWNTGQKEILQGVYTRKIKEWCFNQINNRQQLWQNACRYENILQSAGKQCKERTISIWLIVFFMIGILSILLQQEKVTAPYLAEKFEVSRRTINRDIEDLCRAGIPVQTVQGPKGGISIMEGYKLDSTLLTSSDMQEILAGLRSLDSVSGTKHFVQLMEKLSAGSSVLIPGGQNILIDLSSWYKDSLAPT